MPTPSARNKRIQWLVIALMALCAAPMLDLAVRVDLDQLAVSWRWLMISRAISSALFSVSSGMMLLLSFWVGLGRQPIFNRLLGGVVGAAYVSFWPGLLTEIEFASSLPPEFSYPWEEHATSVLMHVAMVALCGAAFMTLRTWWKLDPTPSPSSEVAGKIQFSLLAVLFVMAGSAVVMGGVRASRSSLNEMEDVTVTGIVVVLSICFANALGATFAALSPNAVRRNCLTAIGTSLLLGIAISLATRQDQNEWWFVEGSLQGIVPAAIVILSLLVVRSTGCRLVRKFSNSTDSNDRRGEGSNVTSEQKNSTRIFTD